MQKVMKEVDILRNLNHVGGTLPSFTPFDVFCQPNINRVLDVMVNKDDGWL